MCAVIGYCGLGGAVAAEALSRLFHQSKIRGLHAFGLAYDADGAILCRKFNNLQMAQAELRGVALRFEDKQLKLIAHCRYSTSGDWREAANNQPIAIDDVALAFNGVIHMGTRQEWGRKYNFNPVTDNDGEVFVRKVLDQADWQGWVRDGEFSFAGVMLYDGALIALRNKHRPLYRAGDYIASTADIFKRAGMGGAEPVTPGEALMLG
jgi:glutamine phosphoribosylpyrophosphate amidotransferase